VKFKVYFDDVYLTDLLWDGNNFSWESGTFSSGAFFNPFCEFEMIETKIEKLNGYVASNKEIHDKLNEVIDELNLLKNNKG
jgi:hypothetical protein